MLGVQQTDERYWLFVLAGHMLQKWCMYTGEPEQLLYCAELGRVIRDAFQCTAWEACATDQLHIEIWLLDIQVIWMSSLDFVIYTTQTRFSNKW